MGLDERIELICANYNLSRTALAKMISVKPQKLHDIARGQTVRVPSDVLEGVSREFPNIRREWLLTGEGNMLASSQPSDAKEVQATPLPDKESYLLAEKLGMDIVPEYSDTFKGGSAGSFISSDTVNAYWGLPNIKADIIAEIDGDSMYPKYPPGSKVALREIPFDPSAPTVGIPFGEVFGITIDNGDDNYLNIIKRLRRHSDPKLSQAYWICQSENTSKYDDFDIEVSKVRHLFVVVASIHLNRM